jgi:predicted NBD/HSP70 family sugar kinase
VSGRSFAVGADVGGTRVRVIVQDLATGERSTIIETPVPGTTPGLVDAVAGSVEQLCAGGRPAVVAIGLPGQVAGGRVVWVPNLRFLDGSPLADLVAERLAAPCRLSNDAQATLLAEAREGAARGAADALLLAVGTGIGGAVLLGGRIVTGAHGCAGSFGWLPLAGGPRDADHGEWETAASGRSLEALGEPWGSVQNMLAAARDGDPGAIETVTAEGRLLGRGAAALASVFDPGVVVFAGGLVQAFDLLEKPMREAMAQYASPAGRTVPVVPAALGSVAGVVGALHLALDEVAVSGPDEAPAVRVR